MTTVSTETVSPASRPSGVPPTTMHRSLLRAALLPEQPALDAWREWRDSIDIETLDPESHHLLSALYPNLVRHGVEDQHTSRLKGVYRRTWYANQLLTRSLAPILQALQREGIESLLLGDTALSYSAYPDRGHRPVYRLDLFVLPEKTETAIETLRAIGWVTSGHLARPGDRLRTHPLQFRQTAPSNETLSVPLYLHNHLFLAEPQAYTDGQRYANATSVEIGGVAALAAGPIDQLLHLSIENNRQGKKRPIYYLADAATLVNSLAGEADWVELITRAQRYEIVLPLRYLLKELREVLDLPVPDWALRSLQRMAISYYELAVYNIAGDLPLLLLKSRLVRLRNRWKASLPGGKLS